MMYYDTIEQFIEGALPSKLKSFAMFCAKQGKCLSLSMLNEWQKYEERQEELQKLAIHIHVYKDDVYELLSMIDIAITETKDCDEYPNVINHLDEWLTDKIKESKQT